MLPSTSAIPFVSACAGRVASALALAAVFPLAAIQLWPTARLAGLAASQRDFEYLPALRRLRFTWSTSSRRGLFHRSPLWRPLVWDPFHTSPEEHLAYIGLVPLFLAVMAMVREWRRDAGRPAADDPFHRDACLEPWALRPGVSAVDHAAGFLVLSSSLALEPGHGAGAGVAGGQGIRSLAGMAAVRAARCGGSRFAAVVLGRWRSWA